MKPSAALDAHRAELRQLVSRHGLSYPRVFGSVLNETDSEESDLDLLVEPSESTTLLTLAGLQVEAERLLGVPVSVLTPNSLPPNFRNKVLQQAEALWSIRNASRNILEHISEAIDRAIGYLQDNADFASFQEDHRNQDAVVRNIEIIGEAASRIQKSGPEFTVQHPEVPWTQMRAMRNLVIHEYFSLDLKIIWSTIKNDLPSLKRQIDILLQGLQRDSGTL